MSAPQPGTSFIVSAPRSGSTWLQTILSALPGMTCIESRAYGRFFEVWPEPDGTEGPRMTVDRYVEMLSTYVNLEGIGAPPVDAFVDAGTKAIVEAIHRTVRQTSGATHVVEKVTPYVGTSDMVLRSLARDFPEAPVVQLLRDGRDVATSGLFHWLKRSGEGSDRHRFFVERSTARLDRFFDDDELRQWCRQWRGPIDAFVLHRADAPVLRYEQIQDDPSGAVVWLLGVLGHRAGAEEIAAACDEGSFERMSGGRTQGDTAPTEHVRRGVVGDWSNYFTRRDGEIFVEETGDLLVELGYEPDQSWVEDLQASLELQQDTADGYRPLAVLPDVLQRQYDAAELTAYPCILCGRTEYRVVCEVDRHDLALRTSQCLFCGMISTNPRPGPDWYRDFYRDSFWPAYIGDRFTDADDMYESDQCLERADQILAGIAHELPGPPRSLLDIGSGQGGMLAASQARFPGIQLQGIEPSSDGAAYCRTRHGVDVHNADWDEASAEGLSGGQSLVTIIHALEHMLDPVTALRLAAGRLDPDDGRLYAEVPNVCSARWRGRGFFHIAHVHYFYPATFRRMCMLAGLAPVAEKEALADVWPWAVGLLCRRAEPATVDDIGADQGELERVGDFIADRVSAPSRRPTPSQATPTGPVPARRRADRPPRVVFASGVGRSGTRALRAALAEHRSIHGNGMENNVVQDVLGAAQRNIRLPARRQALVVPEPDYYRSFRALVSSLLWPDYEPSSDTLALASVNLRPQLMDTALEVFPGARVVSLIRNGIAVVASRMRHRSFRNADFEDHCDIWSRSIEMMTWAEEHPGIATVFRQEWVTDAATLRKRLEELWAFLGVEPDDGPGDHLLSKRYHPTEDEGASSDAVYDWRLLEHGRVERWREWTDEQRVVFVERCGDAMEAAGYDLPFD